MRAASCAVIAAGALAGCALASSSAPSGAAVERVERLRVEVLSERPHDPRAFTQGLELHPEGLLESTGRYGKSELRLVDPETGDVLRSSELPDELFGEGVTRIGDRVLQLTWTAGVARVLSFETFEIVSEHRYEGEGWGLCHDGSRLAMTDGSDTIAFRDPRTFEVLETVRVTLEGRPVPYLNELECAEGWIYANVLGSDAIVRIAPPTGEVTAVVRAEGLLSPLERAGADVLNGIAYDAERETFLVTGKLWPKVFEVRFVPDGG